MLDSKTSSRKLHWHTHFALLQTLLLGHAVNSWGVKDWKGVVFVTWVFMASLEPYGNNLKLFSRAKNGWNLGQLEWRNKSVTANQR